jgi:Delta3-Delta2-enoyl-CoA isomerase
MTLINVTLDAHVATLTMNSGENWLNPSFMTAMLESLENLENDTDASTLILTSSHDKIFSNGLDLAYLAAAMQRGETATVTDFFDILNRFFKRLITYPMITIAAINGHAFAGGAMVACALDFRFMRSDRGYLCLPEIDLQVPFLPGMNALLKKVIPMYKLEEMQYTGIRLTAHECKAHHLITDACHMDELMKTALAYAMRLNKKREVVGEMKNRLHKDILHALDVEDKVCVAAPDFNRHWLAAHGALSRGGEP